MYEKRSIGLAEARAALDAILTAAEGGGPIVVSVVDAEGEMILSARMDGAGHLPRTMAARKAYTAARMGDDSGAFGARMRAAGIDLKDLGDPGLVGFAGAVCVRVDGAVVGAVGVSGRTAEEDEELARIGVAAITS